ncbi:MULTISPECIES: DUF1127 domain-containing protein [unclassified Bradyrhizobium]|uniref:DUF1127 domain-containing protein n=1 Tax=unclassified Bradyrhizobium TaxID=2631580 RepID=UPI001BABAB75|nr:MULTISPECIES: DUF1127 domain-containing protein [unclassified Bradyrhizobium]MBR1230381.1 DUF1127 domain-containing protein [Bradyrhizobium sp. AUGA SZCCT0176]MBR1302195.1 DUF1127 domain-containing protein [Bradyrhizobium sp. AUGA SZCCT0042]
MSTLHETIELGPATAKRQVYSPLETYWNAFQEWRKQSKTRAELYRLTERELMDIGITRGEIDYVTSNHSISLDPLRWMHDIGTPKMTAFGTKRKSRADLAMSVDGGRPEVAGQPSNRRD